MSNSHKGNTMSYLTMADPEKDPDAPPPDETGHGEPPKGNGIKV